MNPARAFSLPMFFNKFKKKCHSALGWCVGIWLDGGKLVKNSPGVSIMQISLVAHQLYCLEAGRFVLSWFLNCLVTY